MAAIFFKSLIDSWRFPLKLLFCKVLQVRTRYPLSYNVTRLVKLPISGEMVPDNLFTWSCLKNQQIVINEQSVKHLHLVQGGWNCAIQLVFMQPPRMSKVVIDRTNPPELVYPLAQMGWDRSIYSCSNT